MISAWHFLARWRTNIVIKSENKQVFRGCGENLHSLKIEFKTHFDISFPAVPEIVKLATMTILYLIFNTKLFANNREQIKMYLHIFIC